MRCDFLETVRLKSNNKNGAVGVPVNASNFHKMSQQTNNNQTQTGKQFFYVTFHSKKNIYKYTLDGKKASTEDGNKVLRDGSEKIHGLRGMLVHDGYLYVANSFKRDSKILKYGRPYASGSREQLGAIIKHDPSSNPGLQHPYGIICDPHEHYFYISNQNTNLITRYQGPSSGTEGRIVDPPKSLLDYKCHPATFAFRPIQVNSGEPCDQGLRGIVCDSNYIFVANKFENRIVVYDWNGFQVNKEINVKNPIGLHYDVSSHVLYIGSHNKQSPCVFAYDTQQWKWKDVTYRHPKLSHPAGITHYQSSLYVISMDFRALLQFDIITGNFLQILIAFDQDDDPEHVIIVTE